MQKIEKVAVVAAILGPIQSVLGWTISGALTPGYDIVSQTISELASVDAPTHILQSSFFILGGTLTILAAIFARTLAMPGRIALFVSGLCTYGLTIFPTPLHGKSALHLLFAITSFVLSAGCHSLRCVFVKTPRASFAQPRRYCKRLFRRPSPSSSWWFGQTQLQRPSACGSESSPPVRRYRFLWSS